MQQCTLNKNTSWLCIIKYFREEAILLFVDTFFKVYLHICLPSKHLLIDWWWVFCRAAGSGRGGGREIIGSGLFSVINMFQNVGDMYL